MNKLIATCLPLIFAFPAAANEAVFLRPLDESAKPRIMKHGKQRKALIGGDYLINGDGKIYRYQDGGKTEPVCDIHGNGTRPAANDWLCHQLTK